MAAISPLLMVLNFNCTTKRIKFFDACVLWCEDVVHRWCFGTDLLFAGLNAIWLIVLSGVFPVSCAARVDGSIGFGLFLVRHADGGRWCKASRE